MNWPLIYKGLGLLLLLDAAALVIPLLAAVFYQDGGTMEFAGAALFGLVAGGSLYYVNRQASGPLRSRGAFFLVAAAWFTAALLGAVPFYLSGAYPTLADAFFESASGFTTTGATVRAEVETLPHAILLWRSLTQFLGGMGIIVLSLAVLPLLGVGGMDLYRAEAPGPKSEKITARVSHTAQALWIVYVFFTVLEVLLLKLAGLNLFDAVNHAFTTMATGGFSTKDTSIAAFESPLVEGIVTVFMFIAGVNFLLHYRLLVKSKLDFLHDREFRFYAVVIFGAIALITLSLWGERHETVTEAVRHASFQVVSIISTTGYGTTDYLEWGYFAQAMLLGLMVIGGCSGSTGGGIKCVRAMMLLKQGYRELCQMVHPKAVLPLKLGGVPVPRHVVRAIFGFFFLYVLTLTLTSLALCALGIDHVTALSATVSALSNVGPALGDVGPMLNYGWMPELGKFLLSLCMIIGRLEVLTVLVLLTPEFWRS